MERAMTSTTTNKFSPEVRDRAVRMVLDHAGEYPSRWAAVTSIAAKIGCTPQKAHERAKKGEVDREERGGVPNERGENAKARGGENRGLRQTKKTPPKGGPFFGRGGPPPPVQAMIAFIDDHRGAHGVEPICKV